MQKLIYSFLIVVTCFSSSYASFIDERKTDIYFGNGVWNDIDQAGDGQDALNGVIQRDIINYDQVLQANYSEVKLQYNWGQGPMDDILETYYQLKEAGQINGIEFFALMTTLKVSGNQY